MEKSKFLLRARFHSECFLNAVAVSAVWHFQDKLEAKKLGNPCFTNSFVCKLFIKI